MSRIELSRRIPQDRNGQLAQQRWALIRRKTCSAAGALTRWDSLKSRSVFPFSFCSPRGLRLLFSLLLLLEEEWARHFWRMNRRVHRRFLISTQRGWSGLCVKVYMDWCVYSLFSLAKLMLAELSFGTGARLPFLSDLFVFYVQPHRRLVRRRWMGEKAKKEEESWRRRNECTSLSVRYRWKGWTRSTLVLRTTRGGPFSRILFYFPSSFRCIFKNN